jgi:hypothetical protein
MPLKRYLVATLLAIGLCTGSGESANPSLTSAELPADVLRDCVSGGAPCGADSFDIDWLGRTAHRHLFLVTRSVCASDDCDGWLVTKDRHGDTRVVLTIAGEVHLEHGVGKYPIVHTRAELSDNYVSYARYEWSDGQYTRTETRLVHRIDGIECGGEDDCDAAAKRALRENQPARAVRIWQQVHGVNWI